MRAIAPIKSNELLLFPEPVFKLNPLTNKVAWCLEEELAAAYRAAVTSPAPPSEAVMAIYSAHCALR